MRTFAATFKSRAYNPKYEKCGYSCVKIMQWSWYHSYLIFMIGSTKLFEQNFMSHEPKHDLLSISLTRDFFNQFVHRKCKGFPCTNE